MWQSRFHYERSPPWSEKVAPDIEPSMQTCEPFIRTLVNIPLSARESRTTSTSQPTRTSEGTQTVGASPVLHTPQ